ncbi:hypothetical protein R3P38DRAFT_3282348 [Favolaschia claudopus]|uniref:Uncharacterized protein n=1 Tax=Favolaschia claudopus TaxID=2862362 RepID=A0AAW0ADT3_9AGAR
MTHVPDSPPTLAKLELLSKLIELISASFRTPAPAPPPRRPVTCSYCSSPRHLIGHYPRVLADIRSGLCKHNALGRVVLPSGLYVPHTVVGPNLRARFLAHTRSQQLRTPLVARRAPFRSYRRAAPCSPVHNPTTTYRAPIISPTQIPGYAPAPRYVVPGISDSSHRSPSSIAVIDAPNDPKAPAHLPTATSIEVSSTAPSPLAPPPDPLEDVFRELALLHLHPDPLRLSALEHRMAQLRDSS